MAISAGDLTLRQKTSAFTYPDREGEKVYSGNQKEGGWLGVRPGIQWNHLTTSMAALQTPLAYRCVVLKAPDQLGWR